VPKKAKELSALAVSRMTAPGRWAVGGVDGLALLVAESGGRSWVLRVMVGGKRREMGLGGYPTISLADARDAARKQRTVLLGGDDPIEARAERIQTLKAEVAAKKAAQQRASYTLAQAARDYHERVIEPSRTTKHGAQWLSSLENHVPDSIWLKPIDSITPPQLLATLLAIRPHESARNITQGERIAETVKRVRQRLDAVFEDAAFHGHCSGNPAAAIKRKLAEGMPRQQKGQFSALPYAEVPNLMQRLRESEGTAARCLEFAVLTVARTAEALAAEWQEVDLHARTWMIPAAKMKAREAHTVYLSDRAVELLKEQQGSHEELVFPSPMDAYCDRPMSNMAMLNVLGRLGVRERTTVHGLARSSFSTWANETAAARPDVIEACLAHDEANKVRAAYNRAEFAKERRALLQAWTDYCMSKCRRKTDADQRQGGGRATRAPGALQP
jgi:integrase